MRRARVYFAIALLSSALSAWCQTSQPNINPTAVFINYEGQEEESTQYSGQAPVVGRFQANVTDADGWDATYEWRFTLEGEDKPYLTRYEEDTEYTFTKAGSHAIVLYATFVQGNDTVSFTEEYWSYTQPIRVTVSESKLEMPNAFSPNDDDINDVYKPKSGWQSLVEFKATIFNRWGQKLYEWTNPNEGWDGTFNGHDVKQGVYFVNVEAKGADGRKYHIRKSVTLMRGYNEEGNSTTP